MVVREPQREEARQQPNAGMSLKAFMRRYTKERPFEVIDGTIFFIHPQTVRSARCNGKLLSTLIKFIEVNHFGEVFVRVPFILPTAARRNWVKNSRVPDVMFVKAERLAALTAADPDWDTGPVPLVPDLIAEVVSPTDQYSEVTRKVERYFRDGVQIVWVVDPQVKLVIIHVAGSNQQTTLSGDAVLTCEPLLPGFTLPLTTLFS